ncbi:hypothetical protein V8F44DRAFT_643256 [Aspergillus fumigatus]
MDIIGTLPPALDTKDVDADPVPLHVKQHSQSLPGGDFTISTYPTDDSPLGTKLFSVKGDFGCAKKAGVTLFVTLPGNERGSEPIATIAKLKTHVYYKGNLVMIAKLANVVSVYVPGKCPAWTVEVAEGMASLTGLLATLFHYSSLSASRSDSSPKDEEDIKNSSTK